MFFCLKFVIPLLTLANVQESYQDANTKSRLYSSKKRIYRPQSRIVGGQDAEVGPMMVSIRRGLQEPTYHMCCGSIISKRSVLTAAHCCGRNTDTSRNIFYDGLKLDDLKQSNNITRKIIHPEYDFYTMTFDFCILHLADEVITSETVKIIKVADDEAVPGDKALMLGWGSDTDFNGHPTNNLKQGTLSVFPLESCTHHPAIPKPYSESEICLKGEDSQSCFRDSGSPIILNKKLIGVCSFGEHEDDGCTPGMGTVYANAPFVKQWIEENIL